MMLNKSFGTVASAVLLLTVSGALADFSAPAITITAQNASGTATWTKAVSDLVLDPDTAEWKYIVDTPIDLVDDVGGQFVARLRGFEMYLQDAPSAIPHIVTQVSVMAGASDTTFTITPATVSFPWLSPPDVGVLMSYVLMVSDNNAGAGGDGHAKMQGLLEDGDMEIYRAWYNGTTRFGESDQLLESWGNGHTESTSGNYPAMGFEYLPVSVSSLRSKVGFTLTPMDYGQVQTQFAVIPEPTAFALLGLGVLSVLVRRR
jgi:hypothetical protein